MKCLSCGHQNKEASKICKKCGGTLDFQPLWTPDWQTHRKILTVIFVSLIALFFVLKWALRKLPPPFHIRQIPSEMTPWLNK